MWADVEKLQDLVNFPQIMDERDYGRKTQLPSGWLYVGNYHRVRIGCEIVHLYIRLD